MMFTYTTKDKMPADADYLSEEAQIYGDLYLGSRGGLIYLDEQKRTEVVG